MRDDIRQQLELQLAVLKRTGLEYIQRSSPPSDFRLALPQDAEAEADPTDHRRIELQQLAKTVSTCKRCPALFATRTQTVFGSGALSPDIQFLGDAPWEEDDRTGQPLMGEAGAVFDRMLSKMGYDRDSVYLSTVIKCRPPRNRNPTAEECANCKSYLVQQLGLVKPKAICCLGLAASQALLSTAEGIQQLRGTVHDYNGTPVVCTFHPVYLHKNEAARIDAWKDMQRLLQVVRERNV